MLNKCTGSLYIGDKKIAKVTSIDIGIEKDYDGCGEIYSCGGNIDVESFLIDDYDFFEYYRRIDSLVNFCNTGKFLDE